MEETPLPRGIRIWLDRQGQEISEAPAAYFDEDGQPRKIDKEETS